MLTIPLDKTPLRIHSVQCTHSHLTEESFSLLAVEFADHTIGSFHIDHESMQYESIELFGDYALPEDALPWSRPVRLKDGTMVYIRVTGELVFRNQESDFYLKVNALLDTELMIDDQERILLLSEPTTQYKHGVLGDSIEAKAVKVINSITKEVVQWW